MRNNKKNKCELCNRKDKELRKIKISEEEKDMPYDAYICFDCFYSIVKHN